MNQVLLRTDKGEYFPGETIFGAVYLDIHTPTEARGVQLSFLGRESVCCECTIGGSRMSLRASNDYIDYCHTELFLQQEPFALGSYCFPFRLQIPYIIPGTFQASSGESSKSWSASVSYWLEANMLDADTLVSEQEVIITAVTAEDLRDNHLTKAQQATVSVSSFFAKKVYLTVKPLLNYVISGEAARLKMIVTNQLKVPSCTFSIKLIRMLTVTLPYKLPPGPDEEKLTSQSAQQHVEEVEGGPFVVREMTGDLSQHSMFTFARQTNGHYTRQDGTTQHNEWFRPEPFSTNNGGSLDNIMIPLKSMDGKNVMPSVQGKYVQCDYKLEVSLRLGDKIQTITCPIKGVLPPKNAQWLSWKSWPWMDTALVKLSDIPGPISPPKAVLGCEAFSRLPGFQVL